MDFQILSIPCLIICLAYFAAGFIDSVCGGGGLVTVPVLITLGFPTHYITGSNQCSTILGSITATYNYIKSGNVHLKSALITIPFSIIGGIVGAKLNMLLPEKYLEIIMLVLVPVIAVIMLVNKSFGTENRVDTLSMPSIVVRSIVIGFTMGAYQGFYGPGGGMFTMLAFALLMKLDMLKSAGNARTVGLVSALSASVSYALAGMILWKMVLCATVFNIGGSYIGSLFAIKKGSKVIKPVVLVVIALLMVKIIFF